MVTQVQETSVERLAWFEEWCAAHGVTWELVAAVPVADIDVAAGLANQARLEPLQEDVVQRYAADMAAGDRFPPILLERRHQAYVALGGNHRIAGARRAGRPALDAYVVSGPASALTLLRYEDNRRHGLPPTNEERAVVAMRLVATGEYTQHEAARAVGMAQGALSKAMTVAEADGRAARLEVDHFGELSRAVRWRLAGVDSDAVFGAAAEIAWRRRLTIARVARLVDELAGADEIGGLRIVGEAAAEPTAERYSGGKPTRSDRRRLEIALSTICHVDPAGVARECGTDDARKLLNDSIRRAAAQLEKIVKGLR